jgi:hypothetical protein
MLSKALRPWESPYLENYIPPQLDSDAVFKKVQLLLRGSETAKSAAKEMEKPRPASARPIPR